MRNSEKYKWAQEQAAEMHNNEGNCDRYNDEDEACGFCEGYLIPTITSAYDKGFREGGKASGGRLIACSHGVEGGMFCGDCWQAKQEEATG